MLVVGASSDRTGERFVHAAACVTLAALGYVGAALLADPVARVVSLALVPAGIYGFLAPIWCLPSAILRGVAAAAGIAFVNSFGNLGGLVGPYTIGVQGHDREHERSAPRARDDGLRRRGAVPRASTTGSLCLQERTSGVALESG
jgi:energy-converting hydrogenase Eha subunit C